MASGTVFHIIKILWIYGDFHFQVQCKDSFGEHYHREGWWTSFLSSYNNHFLTMGVFWRFKYIAHAKWTISMCSIFNVADYKLVLYLHEKIHVWSSKIPQGYYRMGTKPTRTWRYTVKSYQCSDFTFKFPFDSKSDDCSARLASCMMANHTWYHYISILILHT